MKERPILMNGAMVRATLSDIKTQTRRIVKPQPPVATYKVMPYHHPDPRQLFYAWVDSDPPTDVCAVSDWCLPCPYGQPGDRLYVRETYYAFGRWETRFSAKKKRDEWHFVDMTRDMDRLYQFGTESIEPCLRARDPEILPTWWKRPSIFMPRAASRILLEIVSVRVERLNDISYEDALAEGAFNISEIPPFPHTDETIEHYARRKNVPQRRFADLWESINGAWSWDVNPWVWVVEFRRIK